MGVEGSEQRELFRRWPAGVSIVVAEAGGRRAGITVSSLVSLSLEPPLIGISIARSASLFEVIRDAGEWAVSILAGDQAHLAQHFARSVPPLVLWDGISVLQDDERLLEGASAWLVARTIAEHVAGDHVVFVGDVVSLVHGTSAGSLVYVNGGYTAV